MSQKPQSEVQKHFAVGRGLLAAAETLNFSMNEQRQMGGVRVGGDTQDGPSSMSQRGGGSLGSTMKLFASLGLSAADLDALAQIPEDEISVETLPRILKQLKSRKADASEQRAPSMSDTDRRGGGDGWEEGRMGRASLSRSQLSTDFGFNSMQEASSSRGYSLSYANSGTTSREREFSSLSHQEAYGGLGVRPTPTDSLFMQRRIGSPSVGKVQDFLGVMPSMYPHVCSLCDFDVHSSMEWNQHTNGLRHAENRRLLLDMYPEWEPTTSPSRGGGFLEGNSRATSLLGPGPTPSGALGGLGSSWGGPSLPGKVQGGSPPKRSRVVVVKYDRKPLSNKTLFAFAEPFGVLREHLVLRNKAFLEMRSPEEAEDMVNYYDQHPASLYGKSLVFYLSRRLTVIQKPGRPSGLSMEEEMDHPIDHPLDHPMNRPMDRPMDRGVDRSNRDFKGHNSKVVFFSNLPREDDEKKELLTICRRFGVVDKHLFLTDQAFVQLGTVKDAEMLVKYYTVNPLNIKGRMIRLNICAKYKTLNLKRKDSDSGVDAHRSGRNSSSSSSRGRTSSSSSFRSKSREERRKREEEEEKPAQKEEVIQGGEEEEEEEEEGETGGGAEREEPDAEVLLEDGEKKEEQDQSLTEEALNEADSNTVQEAELMEASSNETEGQDEVNTDAAESSDAAADAFEQMDQDFMENMEDFVTLDELQEDEDKEEVDIDKTKKGGMRVVNIVGLRRGQNVLKELLGLAKPFGNVVRHLLLDLKPEAFLQFSTEDEARAMTKFYNGNVQALVCGRPVRVIHSMSYPIIQCGSSRVVYLGQIPLSNYSDDSLLKLAEPFGNIRKYFLNRFKKECFLEMETPEEAEKMAAEFKFKPLKFNGKRLTIYVSRKYRQLKHGHRVPSSMKRSKSPLLKSSKHSDEPVTKKPKEELRVEQQEELRVEQQEELRVEQQEELRVEQQEELRVEQQEELRVEQQEELRVEQEAASADESKARAEEKTSDIDHQQEVKQEVKELEKQEEVSQQNGQTPPIFSAEINNPDEASLLPPYDPDTPVGVEHVKMGYYCRVCCLFYSNEEKAKKVHCSSKTHYDKLQKHLEKKKTA